MNKEQSLIKQKQELMALMDCARLGDYHCIKHIKSWYKRNWTLGEILVKESNK